VLAGRRVTAGLVFCLVLALVYAGAFWSARPAGARLAGVTDFVKYYVVASSFAGKPENLAEVATRFLGSADRSVEVFKLNTGRTQADGGTLTDPAVLRPGWTLVLPWDAVGTGLLYGELPVPVPPGQAPTPKPTTNPTPQPTPKPSLKPTPKPTLTSGKPVTPRASTSRPAVARSAAAASATPNSAMTPSATPGASVPATPSEPAAPPPAEKCLTVVASSGTQSFWAQKRLAPDKAWARSRGDGQTVAVVGSGVDGNLPELAGRVAQGADVISGSGRGDSDCVGSGTAVAGVIAAAPGTGGKLTGMAPDATILPIRVATTASPEPRSLDVATGIEVAVSAGATVIALGSTVDVTDPTVAKAVAVATSHNVVVVCGAPTKASANDSMAGDTAAILRVAGLGKTGDRTADFRPGAVDVVAPGLDVMSLGVNGTGVLAGDGTHYAVGFVAGEAALVRAAYPQLSAADVVHRVKATAERLGGQPPDPTFGWGLINPGAAVNAKLVAESAPDDATPGGAGPGQGLTIAAIVLVVLCLALFLGLRVRRMARGQPTTGQE
jgi:membrane-anchored mycosin MYCP